MHRAGSSLPDNYYHEENHRGKRHAGVASSTTLPRRRITRLAPSTFATMDSYRDRFTTIVPSPMIVTKDRDAASRRHSRTSRISTTLWRSPLSLTTVLLLAFIVFASPAHSVQIPFENCLGDSYRLNEPQLLQWVPLQADASFNSDGDRRTLQLKVWGNVTGQQSNGVLPVPPESNDNGKIIPTVDGSKATTLIRKINFLTYMPYRNAVNFCTEGVNGTCPLGPVFESNNVTYPYFLPSINMSHDFFSSYAFSSLAANFLLVYGDGRATDIGCVTATITPQLGDVAWTLQFLPLLVLLFVGFAVVFAAMFSPWGSTDIFHWTSNYGRDADLLRLVTPGFGDCLQYIQFITLSGALTLNYPGFYQPVVSRVAWSTLMFNESIVSDAAPWQSVVDGIYVTNATYGLQAMGQLVGMAQSQDIWAGMMVWLCVSIISVTVLIQFGFLLQWIYRKILSTPEEDLRAKNVPFSIGNIIRIVFNYFLLPIVALSTFQLVVASRSPGFTVALAVLTIVVLIVFAVYLLHLIIKTRPKSVLFDDLPIVLKYGPLYNTYSDEAAAFALIPVLLTFIRGIAVGAVQPSGIAQVVLLAICEVIQILTVHAFRPFSSPTSMNAYHTVFSVLRLVTILLMVAFSPTLGVTEGTKGWIGYAILLIHGVVLVLGFFLNALQTIVEVVARMLGAGGDDSRGQTRGGLSKIFGMRQLSRRVTARENGPSRASQLSTVAMLDAENGGKGGYIMPGGRVRSDSAASLSGMMGHSRHRSSTALDSIDVYSMPPTSSYMPGTPGEMSTFSFIPSPTAARHPPPTAMIDTSDPYYRPPRRTRGIIDGSGASDRPRTSLTDTRRYSQPGDNANAGAGEAEEIDAEISQHATPAPPPAGYSSLSIPASRQDYSTREVDFYYGVRGPALNSDGPGRRLGTGPADPTGPIATATGWVRNLFNTKTKEKGKGFEVVRSARMPPGMMARNGGPGGETPPEGIPVAMGVLRNGPIDSDDDDAPRVKQPENKDPADLLTGEPRRSEGQEPGSPGSDASSIPERGADGVITEPGRVSTRGTRSDVADDTLDAPDIPRKSSKRHSGLIEYSQAPALGLTLPGASLDYSDFGNNSGSVSRSSSRRYDGELTTSRLPFERTGSQKRSASSNSSIEYAGEFSNMNLRGGREERPASFGMVPQRGVSRVDPAHHEVDLLGTSAELVNEGSSPGRRSSTDGRQ